MTTPAQKILLNKYEECFDLGKQLKATLTWFNPRVGIVVNKETWDYIAAEKKTIRDAIDQRIGQLFQHVQYWMGKPLTSEQSAELAKHLFTGRKFRVENITSLPKEVANLVIEQEIDPVKALENLADQFQFDTDPNWFATKNTKELSAEAIRCLNCEGGRYDSTLQKVTNRELNKYIASVFSELANHMTRQIPEIFGKETPTDPLHLVETAISAQKPARITRTYPQIETIDSSSKAEAQ